MQIGDFHASKCLGGYRVMEVITQGGRLNNQRSRTVGLLKGRDSAVDAIIEMARQQKTDAWISDGRNGSTWSIARHRPSHETA